MKKSTSMTSACALVLGAAILCAKAGCNGSADDRVHSGEAASAGAAASAPAGAAAEASGGASPDAASPQASSFQTAGNASAGASATRSAAVSPPAGAPPAGEDVRTTETGLRYVELRVGTGPTPQRGQTAIVHYVGWLANGQEFDNTRKNGKPFECLLGAGRHIRGWEEGLSTMRVGGKRRLIIPPELGFRSDGSAVNSTGDPIPPNETLTFEVELLELR
jgi:peptidylprolyl isomerase